MPNPWDNDAVVSKPSGGTIINDPYKASADARANAQLGISQAQLGLSAQDQARQNAMAPAQIAKANAEAKLAEIQAQQGASGGRMTAEVRAKALAQWNAATQLDNVITGLDKHYAGGPGATSGIAGLKDFLPTEANQRFNTAGNAARGIVRNALGLTGGEANTAAEAQMNLGAYIPQASDYDATIIDTMGRLRELRDNARATAIKTLGGIPDQNGNIRPIGETQAQPAPQDRNDALAGPHGAMPGAQAGGAPPAGPTGPDWSWAGSPVVNGPGGGAAPAGSTTQAQQIPPQMQAELNSYLSGTPRGSLDEGRFGEFMDALNRSYNVQSPKGGYGAFVKGYNTKGVPINATIQGPEVPMSGVDRLRNNAVNNPVGGAAAGYLDMAGMGIPSALAGDQMAALGDAQPVGTALGQIGGAITGTSAIGKIGRETVGRFAPRVMGGGNVAGMARNLAADSIFGSIYGNNAQGDPLTGAAAAGIGSVAGQGIGGAVSGALTGGGSAAAAALRARGIPLTVGQAVGGRGMFGNAVKGIEDRLSGIPLVGDTINARRLEGLKAFNEAAMGDVTGNNVTATGPQGVEQLRPAVSGMYDSATSGAMGQLDPQALSDLAAARSAGQALPPDMAANFGRVLDNRVAPFEAAGQINGEDFQQVMRAMKEYRAQHKSLPFGNDFNGAIGQVGDALTGAMTRSGGRPVIDGLAKADGAYGRLKVVEDAVARAKNAPDNLFTPAQLNMASTASARRFGGNQATTGRPFYDLASDAQDVLPSRVPDSGTAGRLATLALPGILGGGGYGIDKATGGDSGAEAGLALGAALLAGGTKTGQSALVRAFLDRPQAVAALGRQIGKRQRMFGAAASPFFIEQGAP